MEEFMTIEEVYKQWKNEPNNIGELCIYGGIEGGPGYLGFGCCTHERHPDVRYGCKWCPNNCPDFYPTSENQSFSTFLALYRNNSSYYNKQYDIPETDDYYYPG